MNDLKELTREELERVLLDEQFIGDWEMMSAIKGNPKVMYTVLNKIQKINKIKL
jgi:hypothetical protein